MLPRETFNLIFNHASVAHRAVFYEPLTAAMDWYRINTSIRIAAFTAQVIHESGNLRYVREIASGEAYEGRTDLGNIIPGDGKRFKGRGLIKLVGRNNYHLLSEAFGIDFLHHPHLLEMPHWASLSAAWFWDANKFNILADKDNLSCITKKISGSNESFEDRFINYNRIKLLLAA
jgi:putative chitinase